jgi:hypothetical protein
MCRAHSTAENLPSERPSSPAVAGPLPRGRPYPTFEGSENGVLRDLLILRQAASQDSPVSWEGA